MRFLIGKRGVMDTITVILIIVISMISIVFGYKIISAVNVEVQDMDSLPSESKAAFNVVEDKYKSSLNTGFLLLWFGAFIAALISAWFIDTNPVFFFLSLLILIIIFVAAVPIVNVTEAILTSSMLSSETAEFPIILWFIANFYKIIVVQGVIILITLYAKMRAEQ